MDENYTGSRENTLEQPVSRHQSSKISDFRIQGPDSQHPLETRVDQLHTYVCM